ncbi:MAG: hypothetical protein ABIO72_01975 [Patescibacteria group bacterium]
MDDLVVESSASSFPWIWVIIGLILVILVIYGIWKLARRLTRPETHGLTREQVAERWKTIRQTSQQGQMGAKLAVMEADTLLDSALKSLLMPGTTLGERLKMACYKYPKLKDVWWAHKIRNQLVHEATFQLSTRMAAQALDEFEKAFKILNLL